MKFSNRILSVHSNHFLQILADSIQQSNLYDKIHRNVLKRHNILLTYIFCKSFRCQSILINNPVRVDEKPLPLFIALIYIYIYIRFIRPPLSNESIAKKHISIRLNFNFSIHICFSDNPKKKHDMNISLVSSLYLQIWLNWIHLKSRKKSK